MLSALKRTATLLGLPAGAIQCEPAFFSERFRNHSATRARHRVRNTANIISGLRRCLREAGLHALDPKSRGPLPVVWNEIVLRADQYKQGPLRGLGHWATNQNISPAQITEAAIAEYAAFTRKSEIRLDRNDLAQVVTVAWNSVANLDVTDRRLPRLLVPRRRVPWVTKEADLPASFRQELDAWAFQRAQRPASLGRFLMATETPRRPLAAASIVSYRFGLRQAFSILQTLGHRPETLGTLSDLIQPVTRAAEVLDWLAARQDSQRVARGEAPDETSSPGGQMATVARAFCDVAKHYATIPAQDLTQLQAWLSNAVDRSNWEMTPKNKERLRALAQKVPYSLFMHLPTELMRQANQTGLHAKEAARLARLAITVDILQFCPMRRTNLRNLRLDKHFRRLDSMHPGLLTHIVIPGTETKNRKALEWAIPAPSQKLLEVYLRRYRPILADAACPFVLTGKDRSSAMSMNGLTSSYEAVIQREVGVRANMHLARHLAAFVYLRKYPGRMADVSLILGHKCLETTSRFYVAFQEIAAAERFDDLVLGERRATAAVAAMVRGKGAQCKHKSAR